MSTIADDNSFFQDLVLKYLAKEISTSELSELENYIKQSDENKHFFEESKKAWLLASTYNSGIQNHTNIDWNKIKDSITAEQLPLKKPVGLRILKHAALWIMLIGTGALLTMILYKNSATHKKPGMAEISTPMGSRTHVILPDGSEVWLNAGTTLKYPETFSTVQRDLYLSGEAYFKVTSNKKWPFVVHTSDINIKALGTQFNVTAYPNDKKIVTTLVEGIVKIEENHSDKEPVTYTLKPNSKLSYTKVKAESTIKTGAAQPKLNQNKIASPSESEKQEEFVINENVNTQLTTSWKDPRWIIKGANLEDLVLLLERRFDVKINLNTKDISSYKFSGIIENETLEQVLTYLKYTIPINYTLKKGEVDITINNTLNDKYRTYLK